MHPKQGFSVKCPAGTGGSEGPRDNQAMRKQQNKLFLSRNEAQKLRSEDNSQASLMATKAGPLQSVTPESPRGNVSQQAPPASVLASFLFMSEFIEELQSSQHHVETKLPSPPWTWGIALSRHIQRWHCCSCDRNCVHAA